MAKLKELTANNWEQKIRSGQGGLLRSEILKIQDSKFSRKDTLKLANYARRVGLPRISLKLLRPFVRLQTGLNNNATPAEKSEYAGALIREGIVGEGLKILNSIDDKTIYPESMLYYSFGLFTRWDYEAAVPFLEKYVANAPNEYQKIMGNVNLAASLLFVKKYEDAEYLLKNLTRQTKKDEFRLSHSYCLELFGQYYLQLKEYKMARDYFKKAASLSANSATSMPFLSRKWLAITALMESAHKNPSARSGSELQDLKSIKVEALKISDYETVRTCDLHLAVCKRDKELAKHVYFGSPHRKFRENVAEQISIFCDIPEQYNQSFENKPASKTKVRCFDMHEAKEINSEIYLKNGQAMHRVLQTIASDFYKPVRATEIFSLAFPNEYYDPTVSINRVHQVIKRLRRWLSESVVPLKIIEDNNSYQVIGSEQYLIRWTDRQQVFDADYRLNQLNKKFRNNLFNLHDAGVHLNMPARSVSRLLKNAIENGLIRQEGAGPQTKYRIIEKTL